MMDLLMVNLIVHLLGPEFGTLEGNPLLGILEGITHGTNDSVLDGYLNGILLGAECSTVDGDIPSYLDYHLDHCLVFQKIMIIKL